MPKESEEVQALKAELEKTRVVKEKLKVVVIILIEVLVN